MGGGDQAAEDTGAVSACESTTAHEIGHATPGLPGVDQACANIDDVTAVACVHSLSRRSRSCSASGSVALVFRLEAMYRSIQPRNRMGRVLFKNVSRHVVSVRTRAGGGAVEAQFRLLPGDAPQGPSEQLLAGTAVTFFWKSGDDVTDCSAPGCNPNVVNAGADDVVVDIPSTPQSKYPEQTATG